MYLYKNLLKEFDIIVATHLILLPRRLWTDIQYVFSTFNITFKSVSYLKSQFKAKACF